MRHGARRGRPVTPPPSPIAPPLFATPGAPHTPPLACRATSSPRAAPAPRGHRGRFPGGGGEEGVSCRRVTAPGGVATAMGVAGGPGSSCAAGSANGKLGRPLRPMGGRGGRGQVRANGVSGPPRCSLGAGWAAQHPVSARPLPKSLPPARRSTAVPRGRPISALAFLNSRLPNATNGRPRHPRPRLSPNPRPLPAPAPPTQPLPTGGARAAAAAQSASGRAVSAATPVPPLSPLTPSLPPRAGPAGRAGLPPGRPANEVAARRRAANGGAGGGRGGSAARGQGAPLLMLTRARRRQRPRSAARRGLPVPPARCPRAPPMLPPP